MFDHEKLDVYKASIEFVILDSEIIDNLLRIVSMLVKMARMPDNSGTGTGTGTKRTGTVYSSL